jgi:hypothetical protein
VQLASQLSHPTSAAIALYYAAVVHHWRREHRDAVAKADAALAGCGKTVLNKERHRRHDESHESSAG